MTVAELKKKLRSEFGQPVWALLIYFLLMNVCVMFVTFLDTFSYVLIHMESTSDIDALMEEAMSHVLENGWGYVLAVCIGLGLLLLWKKRVFFFRTIWQKKEKMHFGTFLALLCIFLGGQLFFQLLAELMEWLFNLFGMSIVDSMEAASPSMDSFSMLLYAGILAPISEEILFRGLILRSLQPRGKKFAILASAFLFGIFHGNIVQSPFAFVVGLILGYTAVEYSIVWSIVLHGINNLVLGYCIPKALESLPILMQDLIMNGMIGLFGVAAVIILLVRLRDVKAYVGTKRIHPLCLSCFFTSPAVIILTVLMVLEMLVPFALQLLQ